MISETGAVVRADDRLSAFQAIYEEHGAYVRKTVYWLVRDDAVDDVVQDVFIRVWRSLDRFRNESSLRTWMYRICVNAAHEHFRRAPRVAPAEAVKTPESEIPVHDEDALSMHEVIRKGILRLPEKQRSVFVLFYKQELSLQEIAESLRIPVGTVKSRLFNARDAFIEHLNKNGVDYEKN